MTNLKIAIIAPPFGKTGGPEVATQNLVDGLLKLEQDVTLFAPNDWKTKAKHISTLSKSLWNMKNFSKQSPYVRRNYIISSQIKSLVYDDKFDIFHFNFQQYAYTAGLYIKKPHVITLHNRIDIEKINQINSANFYPVAVTQSQADSLPINKIINHGIPVEKIKPSYKKGSYLITIGRITDQKGIHNSIEIAKKSNKKLIIIGRIGNSSERQKYYKERILPFIDNNKIIHIEKASREEIYKYLRNAEALLFPIIRPEVFGLVIAESLACGTPVITTLTDPMPELLRNNRDISFSSNNIDKLIEVAKNISSLDRKKCRLFAEKNFNNISMAQKYLDFYKEIINKKI